MLRRIVSYIRSLRLVPHVLVFRFSKHRPLLEYECRRWLESHHLKAGGLSGFLLLMNSLPEYRSLFYFRTGTDWLAFLAKKQNNLEFYMPSSKIGRGLVIWHGFSTVINAESIGEDCQIWQNVTIGKKGTEGGSDRPVIGNNVRIAAGAIAVGPITLADNVTVGAGAVVTKDVSRPGTVVVSQPVRYI